MTRTPKNVWEEAMDKDQQENRTRHSLFMLVAKDGKEMLRIDENGDFTVQGRKAGNDKEILEAFRQFLIGSGHLKAKT